MGLPERNRELRVTGLTSLEASCEDAAMDTSLVRLPQELEIEVISSFDESDEFIERGKIFFANGYGVSIIRGRPGTMLEEVLPPEGAVLDSSGELDYSTPLANDVVRFANAEEVREFVLAVAALPKKTLGSTPVD